MKFSLINLHFFLKKNIVNDVYFIDSFGGIKSFFDLFEEFNHDNNFIIISNNKASYQFLSSLKPFRNKIFYYEFKNLLLENYLFMFYLVFFKFFFKKVKRIFCYKLIQDSLRFYIINLISSDKTEIYVSDQFYKFYDFASPLSKKYHFGKKFLIFFLNLFCKIKIQIYKHIDLGSSFYPSLNKNYQFECNKNSWKFYKQKYFKKKIDIKNNSLLIIDETINLLIERNWLDMQDFPKNFNLKFFEFLKKKNIKHIYYKNHPTSKIDSYIINQINKKKIKFLKKNFPIEFVLDDFNYCILSNSSSIFFTNNVKFYHITKLLKFKKNSYKKKYEMLLKKNSGKNYSKLVAI